MKGCATMLPKLVKVTSVHHAWHRLGRCAMGRYADFTGIKEWSAEDLYAASTRHSLDMYEFDEYKDTNKILFVSENEAEAIEWARNQGLKSTIEQLCDSGLAVDLYWVQTAITADGWNKYGPDHNIVQKCGCKWVAPLAEGSVKVLFDKSEAVDGSPIRTYTIFPIEAEPKAEGEEVDEDEMDDDYDPVYYEMVGHPFYPSDAWLKAKGIEKAKKVIFGDMLFAKCKFLTPWCDGWMLVDGIFAHYIGDKYGEGDWVCYLYPFESPNKKLPATEEEAKEMLVYKGSSTIEPLESIRFS